MYVSLDFHARINKLGDTFIVEINVLQNENVAGK
jgi:hypothetical protein